MVERLALGVTSRALLAAWLEDAFDAVPGWRLAPVVPRTPEAVSAALGSGLAEAILVDVAGDPPEALSFCRLLASRRRGLSLIAISCCGCENDELLLELLRIGLAGYIVCDEGSRSRARLMEALRGSPVWPVERLARLARRSDSVVESISLEERRLIRLCARGLRYGQIAAIVGLSAVTVRHQMDELRRRTNCLTPAAVAAWAAERGLLTDERGNPPTPPSDGWRAGPERPSSMTG